MRILVKETCHQYDQAVLQVISPTYKPACFIFQYPLYDGLVISRLTNDHRDRAPTRAVHKRQYKGETTDYWVDMGLGLELASCQWYAAPRHHHCQPSSTNYAKMNSTTCWYKTDLRCRCCQISWAGLRLVRHQI